MNSKNLNLEILKRQKEQAELALKAQIRIGKSILSGYEPLNTYHFQRAIENIKHFRILSRESKQNIKDLELLTSTTYLDSHIIKETVSQFKYKIERSKEFIESKFTVKNFEDMNLEEMSNLTYHIHNKWLMKILPPITFEDIKRGFQYLNEKKASLGMSENNIGELKKVENIELSNANLFSEYLLKLYEKIKSHAGNKNLLKWEEIIKPEMPLGKKSRIAQGLSHLSFQNKLWLVKRSKGDFFLLND